MYSTVITRWPGSSGPYCQKILQAAGVRFSTYESHTFTSRSAGKLS